MRRRGPQSSWRLVAIVLGGVVYGLIRLLNGTGEAPPVVGGEASSATAVSGRLLEAIEQRQSRVWVETGATVRRLLRDDNEGSRHQRFLVEVDGHSILVAHNIDLAPRVPLREGQAIALRGRFEWNDKGGVIHWTHHDPKGRREGGWIRAAGQDYR